LKWRRDIREIGNAQRRIKLAQPCHEFLRFLKPPSQSIAGGGNT